MKIKKVCFLKFLYEYKAAAAEIRSFNNNFDQFRLEELSLNVEVLASFEVKDRYLAEVQLRQTRLWLKQSCISVARS